MVTNSNVALESQFEIENIYWHFTFDSEKQY